MVEFEGTNRRGNLHVGGQNPYERARDWLASKTGRNEANQFPIQSTPASKDTFIGRETHASEGLERVDVAERPWGIRKVRSQDIPHIASWFQNRDVIAQIYDENVNPHIPKSWQNAEQVAKFQRALNKFLVPIGPFPIETKTPYLEGDSPPENKKILVSRTAKLALTLETDDEGAEKWVPAGVQCWLSNDPYAPQEDRDAIDKDKLKVGYGHFLIVDPKYREKGAALYLSTARADELLGKSIQERGKFDQISTLVKRARGGNDPAWEEVLSFFLRFGYDFDRRPEGKSVIPLGQTSGTFDRMLITANDWWREFRARALQGLKDKDIKYK